MTFERVDLSPEVTVYRGDCLQVMPTLGEVNVIVTDPPYNGVLDESWDNAWESRQHFLEWLGMHFDAYKTALRFNGSLWCFAYPTMAAYVEVEIGKRFNVLNHIVWNKKNGGTASRSDKSALRAFIPLSERIIFAEHYGADNAAKGESGWGAKCDDLRGFVFEPLRAYLDGEKKRAGIARGQVDSFLGNFMSGHYFRQSQWALPTIENYEKLRALFNHNGGDYLRREYEDLRREYEDLRREYEDLRRPFAVSDDVPYSDVWTFNTSRQEGTLHPAQKPIALMLHIIQSSTRPHDLILDPFAGSGTTGVAAIRTGRRVILIEQDPGYFEIAVKRCERELAQPRLFPVDTQPPPPEQLKLSE